MCEFQFVDHKSGLKMILDSDVLLCDESALTPFFGSHSNLFVDSRKSNLLATIHLFLAARCLFVGPQLMSENEA